MIEPDASRATAERERVFLRLAETAGQVRDRCQFFVWLGLQLGQLIAHDVALCRPGGVPPPGAGVRADVFNGVRLDPGLEAALADGCSPLWRDFEACWAAQGRRATVANCPDRPALGELARAGLGMAVVHGVELPDRPGPPWLFVLLSTAPAPAGAASRDLQANLELCLPILLYAAIRASTGDAAGLVRPGDTLAEGRRRGQPALTHRQLQIVCAVRDAKHNAEIAQMLGIRPATVKNHLHALMRKLRATNRAQLVAEVMARRLIS